MRRELLLKTTILCVALAITGCSALHWGGEAAGENPGIHVRAPSLFSPGEISATSNAKAHLDKFRYVTPDGTQLEFEGADFGQDAASVMAMEPAKLKAIEGLQRVQVEYVTATWQGIVGLAHELVPVFKLLAAAQFMDTDAGISLTLPNGMTIGGQRVTSAAQLKGILEAAGNTLETAASPTTQPAGGP